MADTKVFYKILNKDLNSYVENAVWFAYSERLSDLLIGKFDTPKVCIIKLSEDSKKQCCKNEKGNSYSYLTDSYEIVSELTLNEIRAILDSEKCDLDFINDYFPLKPKKIVGRAVIPPVADTPTKVVKATNKKRSDTVSKKKISAPANASSGKSESKPKTTTKKKATVKKSKIAKT
jgi:hypothetical protein